MCATIRQDIILYITIFLNITILYITIFQVKVLVQFKGREMQHRELGYQVLARFLEPISDTAMVESAAKVEGRSMFMLIAPKKIEKK